MAVILDVVELTKRNLQLDYTTHQDDYIHTLTEAAKVELKREGVSTLSLDDVGDVNLVAEYASYLYRLRASQSVTADSSNNKYFATTSNNQGIMPHMLRRHINNRVFQEKANA